MKYSTTRVSITPDFKVKQAGFIQQVNEISNVHDLLHARIVSFFDNEKYVFLISCDNLGFPISIQQAIEKNCEEHYQKECHVILSSTHTHFGADPKNSTYQLFCISTLSQACIHLNYIDAELSLAYSYEPFDLVGKSRISNHVATTLLQLVSIFSQDKRIITFIVHNCHPTIMNGDTPFFSAEYPGYVTSSLKSKYPDEFFTFMQGADGDISTRFTRTSQDYSGVEELGNLLVGKIIDILPSQNKASPLTKFTFYSKTLTLEHSFDPIDLSCIPENLTPREMETIDVGVKVRKHLMENLDSLDKEISISSLKLGSISLVFEPNELFSSYIDAVDTSKSILVCYSNGYSPYVTGCDDNFITYEKFTDTYTRDIKSKLLSTITELSNL